MKNQHVGYLANNESGKWSKWMHFSKAPGSSYSLSTMYDSPCSALSTVSHARPSSANSVARRQRTSRTSASSKSGNHSLELHSLNWKCSFFCPARCIILSSHHGRPQLKPAPIQSRGHQLTHGLLYIYCSFSCSAQFPLFNDTNKHILPNCIKDTVKGATNVKAHEFCNDPLNEQLQEWCGGAGQVLNFDIQMSKIIIPWILSRPTDTLNAIVLDFSYSFQTSLYWYELLPHQTTDEWQPFLGLIFQALNKKKSRLLLLKEEVTTTYTTNFTTWWNISLNASPDLVFIFTETNICSYTIVCPNTAILFPLLNLSNTTIQHIHLSNKYVNYLLLILQLFISTQIMLSGDN